MLDGEKEEHIDSTETKDTLVSSSKRRLVKSGALAVPVVLTLRSGAAMAMDSAKQCIDNNAKEAQGADPLITPGEQDDHVWVRKEVDCRKLEGNGEIVYVYKNPSEPAGIENPDKWLREEDNAVFIEVQQEKSQVRKQRHRERDAMEVRKKHYANQALKKMVKEADVGLPNIPMYEVKSEEKCQVLVLVDSQGNIVKYGKSGIDEVAITTSCWASINGDMP